MIKMKPRSTKQTDKLWNACLKKARSRGETLSAVIRRKLEEYLAED